MFVSQPYADIRVAAESVAVARTETALATGAQVCDAMRQVQAASDVLDGVRADLMARLDQTEGHADEGAPTAASWAVRELRMSVGAARRLVRAGRTLQTLPKLTAAMMAGRVRMAHVDEFTGGITKVGADVMSDTEDLLVPIAESSDPRVVREAVNHLNETINPDKLDDEYAKGMSKRDVKLAKCGEGWHLSGFLDQLTGTKLNNWLKRVSRAESESDDRAPSDRRVDGLERLLDSVTERPEADTDRRSRGTGGETDNGNAGAPGADDSTAGGSGDGTSAERARKHRPRPTAQLLVLAELEALLRRPGAEPATLVGFGHIGQQLLGYLTCTAGHAGVLVDGVTDGPTPQADVLNVGRTSRLATARQRSAVLARQGGECANPGCTLTHLEIHHVEWWDRDTGPTDLDNLIGLCSRCHHLVHQSRLTVEPDGHRGFVFRRKNGRVIDDHTRAAKQKIRAVLARIRQLATATSEASPPVGSPTGRGDRPRIDQQWLTPIERVRPGAEEHVYAFLGHHDLPSRT